MVQYSFNAQQYEPKYGGSGGLPLGPNKEPVKYKVVITESEQKPTAKGDGGYLALTLSVIEGPCTGQTQQDNLNLHNPNAKAVEIANKQLSAYCHVTGVFVINDTAQLHNIPFIIEVRQQRNNPDFTEVGQIFDINGNEAGKGNVVQQQPNPPMQQPPAQVQPQGSWNGAAPGPGPAAQPQPGPGAWQPPTQGAQPAPAAWGGQPAAQTGGWSNK